MGVLPIQFSLDASNPLFRQVRAGRGPSLKPLAMYDELVSKFTGLKYAVPSCH